MDVPSITTNPHPKYNNMKSRTKSVIHLALAIFAGCAIQSTLQAQVLVLDYNFNAGSGSTYANSGTGGGNGTFVSNTTAAPTGQTPGYSANAGGVSGLSGDYAFDNSSATGMGTSGVGGRGFQGTGINIGTGRQSWALTGWINVSSAGSSGRIFETSTGSGTTGVGLVQFAGGQIFVSGSGTGAPNANAISSAAFSSLNTWYFLAITWDGNAAANQKFTIYSGTTAAAAINVLTTQATDSSTSFGTTDFRVSLGNAASFNRPFDGLLDNMRFYVASDSSAAFNSTQINDIRVATIPEPSTALLLGAVGIGFLLLRCRRKAMVS